MAEGNLRRKEWNKRNENERGNERIKTEMKKKWPPECSVFALKVFGTETVGIASLG